MITPDQVRVFEALRGCTEHELEVLLGAARARRFAPGDVLCEEGGVGASCFFIVSGDVEVVRATPEGPRVIAMQGAGAIVGQVALVEHRPRTAAVRAAGEVTALEFTREVFDALLDACSPFAIRFQEQIAVAGIRQLRNATERLLEVLDAGRATAQDTRDVLRYLGAATLEWGLPVPKKPPARSP